MKMKFSLHPLHLDKTLLIRILLLVLLDQMIKRIIVHFCYTANIDLIGSFLRFYPIINPFLSLPGNYLPIFQDFHFLIVINILTIILSKYLLSFYHHKIHITSFTIVNLYIFFQAGAIASLLDKVLWHGSLDYLMVNELFVIDLKDCYLFGSVMIGSILMVKNYKKLKKIKRSELFHFIIQRKED
ncbi:MAG: signal peptidase II [Clostridiales bacterium]|nr:signal peptidase II [Clostridiales bacterium]